MKVKTTEFEYCSIDLLNLGHALKQKSQQLKNDLTYKSTVRTSEHTTEEVTLFDEHMLYTRMMNYHFNKSFIFHVNKEEYTEDIILPSTVLTAYFMPLWEDYKKKNVHGWEQMLEGWFYHYNPTENYFRLEDSQTLYLGKEINELGKDGTEKSTLKKSGQEKTTFKKQGKEVNEMTYSGSETDTNNIGARNSSSERGKNPYEGDGHIGEGGSDPISGGNIGYLQEEKSLDHSSAAVDSTTTTFTNRKDKNELSFEDNRQDTSTLVYGDGSAEGARVDETELSFNRRLDTNTKYFDDREDGYHSEVHGNVGTTQSSEMVQNEILLRLHNLADQILDDFIGTYCIYIDNDL